MRGLLIAFWLGAAVGAALLAGGCGGPVGCAAVVRPAIEVFVFDARTKAPAAAEAVATIRDGDYRETLQVLTSATADSPDAPGTALSLGGGWGRPGTYTVRVEKAGYEPWEITGVRVQEGECTVEGARLEAYLQPSK